MIKPDLSQADLKKVLNYYPDTGIFIRINARRNTVAGYLDPRGYIFISICNHSYRAHRLAWLYVHGEWPADQIDHIDGNRANNRIDNLRSVTREVNAANVKWNRNNKTGVMGVVWEESQNRWHPRIQFNSKRKYLGSFDSFFEAICARKSAELKCGLHPSHGSGPLPEAKP